MSRQNQGPESEKLTPVRCELSFGERRFILKQGLQTSSAKEYVQLLFKSLSAKAVKGTHNPAPKPQGQIGHRDQSLQLSLTLVPSTEGLSPESLRT